VPSTEPDSGTPLDLRGESGTLKPGDAIVEGATSLSNAVAAQTFGHFDCAYAAGLGIEQIEGM
jgi:hypothetical protein